jgi:hypothetical protein
VRELDKFIKYVMLDYDFEKGEEIRRLHRFYIDAFGEEEFLRKMLPYSCVGDKNKLKVGALPMNIEIKFSVMGNVLNVKSKGILMSNDLGIVIYN